MYDNLFADVFTSSFQKNPTVPGHHFNIDPTSILTDRLESTGIDQAVFDQVFGIQSASLAMYPHLSDPVFTSDPLENISEQEIMEPPLPPPPPEQPVKVVQPEMPSVAEYYQFGKPLCSILRSMLAGMLTCVQVLSFLTTYAWHMPVVHLPTFLSESRHPALVKASKACGAMYSNTAAATHFIDMVLSTVRDVIIGDLVSALM